MEVGIELEPADLNAAGLRKILKGMQSAEKQRHKQDEETKDKEDDEKNKEADDLVDLHREKKGDSKPPAVTKDDVPKALQGDDDSDDESKEDE
jgi:NAD(P)H-dependent FMN reductase